jgi:hypothetical protein
MPNQSGMTAFAFAIAVFDAATMSAPLVWCRSGSERRRSRIVGTWSVPSTRPPISRYSSSSLATWARPISWISCAPSDSVV